MVSVSLPGTRLRILVGSGGPLNRTVWGAADGSVSTVYCTNKVIKHQAQVCYTVSENKKQYTILDKKRLPSEVLLQKTKHFCCCYMYFEQKLIWNIRREKLIWPIYNVLQVLYSTLCSFKNLLSKEACGQKMMFNCWVKSITKIVCVFKLFGVYYVLKMHYKLWTLFSFVVGF